MKLLIMQSPSVHCYRVRLSLNILSTPPEAENTSTDIYKEYEYSVLW